MNVLFFCEDAVIDKTGGVQNVTILWRDYLIKMGYNVYIVYRKNNSNYSITIPQDKLPFESHQKSKINIGFLVDIIKNNSINIVINQAAQGPITSYVCIEACKKTRVPLISIVHNSPDAFFKRITKQHILFKNKYIKTIVNQILPYLIRRFPRYGSRRLVRYSSAVIVLAPEYIEEYERLYIGKHSEKIIALPNPVPEIGYDENYALKENIALFVGRLSKQKAVDKILKIWKKIEDGTDNAKLYIVGDGELTQNLKELARSLNLKRVLFEGFQDPRPYYQRAKVFMMTSVYEGLPMTLLECQQYGVVPVVMNTFSAANGILGDKLSPYLIPSTDSDLFCNKVTELLKNDNIYRNASEQCLKNIRRFSVESIGQKFENIILNCLETQVNNKLCD